MKYLFTLGLLFCFLNDATSQIGAVYNKEKRSVEFKSKEKVLKKGENYTIKLENINTAHHSFKVQAKSFELYSETPASLALLPGIKGSIRKAGDDIPLTNLKLDSISIVELKKAFTSKVEKLAVLKKQADSLYEQTAVKPDIEKVNDAYAIVNQQYFAETDDELLEKIGMDIYALISIVDVLDAAMKNQGTIRPDLADFYAVSTFRADVLKKNNYLSYMQYIMGARKAENFRESKAFKSEKDLTEIRLILVDTYKKDTIFNGVETLYNKGGFGLSFSTGFFYTNGLGDMPYYLRDRPDGSKAVKADQEMKSDIAIGGFGHVYYKATSCFRVGPGIGIAVSPFDGKTRYMAGVGFVFGRERTIALTTGLAWAKVKQLSDLVLYDAEGAYLPTGTTTVPTFETMKTSWFVGVSYNLFSTRK